MPVQVRVDRERGCGWRKPGGLYLVCTGFGKPCGKLPIPLCRCPTCGAGIKRCRSWTWVDADALSRNVPCKSATPDQECGNCPLNGKLGRAGLLWVGGQYYATPEDFRNEARAMGISRRVPHVPKDFKVGETWVLLAHRRAIESRCDACSGAGGVFGKPDGCWMCGGSGRLYQPGVFHAFQPTAVEYVVRGTETPDEIAAMEKRGITPVRIERFDPAPPLIPAVASYPAAAEEPKP